MVNNNRRDTFESLQQRLTQLQRTAAIKSGPSDPILGETIELLQCTLETLRTTEEQLRQREAELAQTRQLAQPEHQGLDQRLEQPELRYQQLEEALRATEERYR
jgi:chromosome segregation ATPase